MAIDAWRTTATIARMAGSDADEEMRELRRAAEAGDAQAQFRYGLALAQGGDAAAARAWCERAAAAGDALAQFNLGLLHIGAGRPAGPALHWLRLAALNGVEEAAACCDLVYQAAGRPRPATWDEAETRASVALAASDGSRPKRMRLADYYADPCLDLLVEAYRIERDQAEDIVQQFFLELEQPLAKGEHRGRRWKDALRARYQPERGAFRAFLRRTLVNFARDWMRSRRRRRAGTPREPALAERAADCAVEWRAALARFAADAAARGPALGEAAQALAAVLGEGVDQAELAQRLGVTTRSVRTRLALGGEALHHWLAQQAATAADPAVRAVLERALVLLPGWLRFPGAEKRARIQLLLALL